jgi:hypothetical protein
VENAIHRFVRLLRLRQVRISIPEALDAMACAGQPGMLADRAHLKAALRVALIKDRRDEEVFDEVFDRFFALVKVGPTQAGHGHGHGHEDLSDTGALEDFTLSDEPSETPQQGHSHGKPVDIRDYFDPEDLAQQYNLHQEANKIDLAAMTEEIVLSKDGQGVQGEGSRVQIETDRLSNASAPGQIAQQQGTKVDADLSVAEQEALLGWLNDVEDELGNDAIEDDAAALRRRLTGVLAGLPEAIKRHLEALLALEQRIVESNERAVAAVDRVGEHERMELEESLRRLAHSLHGGLRAPGGARPRDGVRRRRARRRRELRLRRGVRRLRRGLLLGGDPAHHRARPGRRTRQRQRREPPGVRGHHPPRPRDDLADPRAALLLGPRGLRPADYAEYCSRVRVVRDLSGLETAATELATELVGR